MSLPPDVIVPDIPPVEPAPPLKTASPTVAYILVFLGMAGLVLASIVVVTVVRPKEDNTNLYAIIIAFAATTAASISGIIKSDQNGQKLEQVHIVMNGRFSEWQNQTKKTMEDSIIAAYNAGIQREREKAPLAVVAALPASPRPGRSTDVVPPSPTDVMAAAAAAAAATAAATAAMHPTPPPVVEPAPTTPTTTEVHIKADSVNIEGNVPKTSEDPPHA